MQSLSAVSPSVPLSISDPIMNFEKKTTFTDLNKNITKFSTGSRIYRKQDFYFIRDGDFDVVWRNVYIFIAGHLMWAYGLYLLVTQQLLHTWIYSKLKSISGISFPFL
jgi:hypothetical protein